jgi:hypothetical protein
MNKGNRSTGWDGLKKRSSRIAYREKAAKKAPIVQKANSLPNLPNGVNSRQFVLLSRDFPKKKALLAQGVPICCHFIC